MKPQALFDEYHFFVARDNVQEIWALNKVKTGEFKKLKDVKDLPELTDAQRDIVERMFVGSHVKNASQLPMSMNSFFKTKVEPKKGEQGVVRVAHGSSQIDIRVVVRSVEKGKLIVEHDAQQFEILQQAFRKL